MMKATEKSLQKSMGNVKSHQEDEKDFPEDVS